MTLLEYETLTGLTVTNETLTTAQIARTQRILEGMLGFTLDEDQIADNQYVEIGKTDHDCPCTDFDIDIDNLEAPDAVVYAYRLFTYNPHDKFFSIDPATEIHAVKLVKDGVTFKTLDPDEYRIHFKQGFAKYIEECETWCGCELDCDCVQLAVDASWLFPIPGELTDVWTDMITYYSDQKFDIRSETLGTHSYTRGAKSIPETMSQNLAIIKKYAGPNGTLYHSIVI